MNQLESIRDFNFTVIGKSSQITGDCHFNGHTSLAGTFEGKATSGEKSFFVIERFGQFKGELLADHVEIYGQFHGALRSQQTTIIHSSATVEGSIHCRELKICPGAIVNIDGHTKSESEDAV